MGKAWYNHKQWYGYGGTVVAGDAAEEAFRKVAENQGFIVTKGSEQEDKQHHIDCFLDDSDHVYSVDVKARKRISRRDPDYCDDWTYVEFRLPGGARGWLYHKAVDFIAFETPDDFLVVEREALRELAESMVNINDFVDDPHDAKYKVFSRRGSEQVSLIETKFVRQIAKWVWPKDRKNFYSKTTDQTIAEIENEQSSLFNSI